MREGGPSRRRSARVARVVALAGVLLACAAAVAEPVRALRGIASHVDVAYEAKLRPRSDQSPTSPVLVRVSPVAERAGVQRIEFIGAVAGTYDLREFVEREDGRAAADLPALPAVIGSQLPADAGTDLYSSGASWFNWAAHYRTLLWIAVGLWAAVPVVYLAVRAMRKPRVQEVAPGELPAPTLEEELRAAISASAGRELSVDERGRLELLVLRYLGSREGRVPESPDEVAALFQRLRRDGRTGGVVVALERWLHARNGEQSRADAARALEELDRSSLRVGAGEASLAPGGAA